MGPKGSFCLVSEPLNDETDTWVEIPAGSAVILSENGLDAAEFKPEVDRTRVDQIRQPAMAAG